MNLIPAAGIQGVELFLPVGPVAGHVATMRRCPFGHDVGRDFTDGRFAGRRLAGWLYHPFGGGSLHSAGVPGVQVQKPNH